LEDADSVPSYSSLVEQKSYSTRYSAPSLELPDSAIDQFLNLAAHSSYSIAAVYQHTKDAKYRIALEKRLLLDPQAGVLLAIACFNEDQSLGDRDKALKRIGLLRQAHGAFPNDVILAGMLAGTEAELGQHIAALSLLGDNAAGSSVRESSVARQQAVRDLMLKGGLDAQTAWIASAIKENENLFAISAIVNSLVKSSAKIPDLPLDAQVEAASRIVALARALNPYEDTAELNAAVALSLEAVALKRMPSEMEYGEAGETVMERLAYIRNANADGLKKRKTMDSLFRSVDDAVLQGFFQRREQFGNPVAVEWIQNQAARRK
jgi:hypothetical protein